MATYRSFTSAAALFFCATTAFAQAPANDDCGNRTVAVVGSNLFDLTGATTDGTPLDPLVCDMSTSVDEDIYQEVWFNFTAPSTDNFTFDTDDRTGGGDSISDTRMAIYDSTACPADALLVLACDDDQDSPFSLQAGFSVDLVGGNTYKIRVGTFAVAGTTGAGDLFITLTPPPPPAPANDDCGNALVVSAGLTAFDSTSATDGAGLPLDPLVCDMSTFGDDQIYADVWFEFSPATTDFYDIASVNNGGVSFDSRIAVYNQATCPDDPNLVIGCDDDDGPILEALASGVPLASGSTYLIRVGSFDATEVAQPAALSITIGVATPFIANDDCANATPLTMFGTTAYDNTIATTDGLDLAGFCDLGAFGDEQVYNDLWYAYTPTVGGCTYISTFGLAGYDTRLAVYTGATCPNDPATVLACNDDEDVDALGANTPFEAGLDVTLMAGTTYLIRVGNFGAFDAGGPASFQIAAGPMADVNNTSGAPQIGAPGCAAGPAFNEFCFGDGGNQMGCTNCPCANEAPIGSGGGCLNSAGTGTRLTVSGDTSVSLPSGDTTDLRFGAEGAPATAFCILNSGDALAPGNMANPCFGLNTGAQAAAFDGLRCAITNTRRHGGRSADGNGDVGVTNNPWGGEGGPPVGIAVAGGGFASGQTRFFQIINRDDPLAVCTRALNTSQAVEVMFTP